MYNPTLSVFKFQMVKAKGDLRFQFPERPNGPDDLCNPNEHACATIQRDCLHYNMTKDGGKLFNTSKIVMF